MKKILSFGIILFLFSLLLIPCYAEGTEIIEEPDIVEEQPEDGWTIGEFFDKYADTIITCVCSVCVGVIAYLFKGALIPSMKTGLSSLSATLKTTDEKFDEFASSSKLLSEKTENSIKDAIQKMGTVIESLETLCVNIGEEKETNARQQEILLALALILKEGFTAANLPAYTKDRINSAIDKIEKEMGTMENEETV